MVVLPAPGQGNNPPCKKYPQLGAWVHFVGCINCIFISFGGPLCARGGGMGGIQMQIQSCLLQPTAVCTHTYPRSLITESHSPTPPIRPPHQYHHHQRLPCHMSSPVFHFHLVPITRTYLWGEMNINLGRTTGLSSCSSLITYLKVSHLLVSLAFSKASFFVSLCAICSHPSYLVSITRSSQSRC